jgi:hypothetical protein
MRERWAIVVALFAVGCGATFESASVGPDAQGGDAGGMDSSVDGGSTVDGSVSGDAGVDASQDAGDAGAWSTVCPTNDPILGTPCSVDTLQCEYPKPIYLDKLQYDVTCDTVHTCASGTWTDPAIATMACNPDTVNSTACPARFDEITNGGGCPEAGLQCEYTLGFCTCAAVTLGGVALPVDAGSSWTCEPGAGCPSPRPRLGSACPTDGQACTYEACAYAQTCRLGVWQGGPVGCAEPGTSP